MDTHDIDCECERCCRDWRREAERLRAELLEARSALGVALVLLTPDQQMAWQERLRRFAAEAAQSYEERP